MALLYLSAQLIAVDGYLTGNYAAQQLKAFYALARFQDERN